MYCKKKCGVVSLTTSMINTVNNAEAAIRERAAIDVGDDHDLTRRDREALANQEEEEERQRELRALWREIGNH